MSRFNLARSRRIPRTSGWLALVLRESPPPLLARGASFGRRQEVLEGDVDERRARVGEDVAPVDELAGDVDSAASLVVDVRADQQLGVDLNRPAVVNEEAAGDGRKAVPGGKEAASLVERGRDEPAVDE